MTDQRLTELTALTATADGDQLYIVDVSDTTDSVDGTSKKVAVSTLLYDVGNVLLYGADPTGTSDSTTAIQAAIDAVYAAGGGTVYLPAGTYLVTSLSRVFSGAVCVNLIGEGRFATKLQKTGGTTTPIINFSASTLQTPLFKIANLSVIGNAKGHDGIRLTLLGQFSLDNVSIYSCDTALDILGSLLFKANLVIATSNNVGVMTRTSGSINCNQITFDNCLFNSNTTWGMDIGNADGVYINECDFERNGTAGNTATGGIIIRDTVDDESVYSYIELNHPWFEWNRGRALEVEAATGLALAIRGQHFYANAGGSPAGSQVYNVGAIRALTLDNVNMLRTNDEVISAATRTMIFGQPPATYTDNSNTTIISSVVDSLALYLKDGISAPSTSSGKAIIYVDTADGDLKVKFGDGTVKTIATDT